VVRFFTLKKANPSKIPRASDEFLFSELSDYVMLIKLLGFPIISPLNLSMIFEIDSPLPTNSRQLCHPASIVSIIFSQGMNGWRQINLSHASTERI
jgi:hypothetical protein